MREAPACWAATPGLGSGKTLTVAGQQPQPITCIIRLRRVASTQFIRIRGSPGTARTGAQRANFRCRLGAGARCFPKRWNASSAASFDSTWTYFMN